MPSKMQTVSLLPVRNMNRALRFYTKVLGAKLTYRGRGKMRDFWASLKLGGVSLWLVAPGVREKRNLAYTALLVRNTKRYVRELQRRGVKFQRAERMSSTTKVEGPVATDEIGASAFFKDSEGNLWMVWQNFPPM